MSNIPVCAEVLRRAKNAERKHGRTLGDALSEFIASRLEEDNTDDVACHTTEESQRFLDVVIDASLHD